MATDPYRYFRPEARNLLDQLAQGLLDLEKDGAIAGTVPRLLRLAHTLKGAARVVRQSAIAERAHAIEDALEPFRHGADGIGRDHIDAILKELDEIGSQIATLATSEGGGVSGEGAAPSVAATAAINAAAETAKAASDPPRIIRADSADMDAVLDGVAEAQTRLNGLRRSAEALEEVTRLADLVRLSADAPRVGDDRPAGGRLEQTAALAEKFQRSVGSLAAAMETSIAQVDRELRQLRDAAEALRLVPVASVLTALERTARDCARAAAKEVTFAGSGGDVRLDADMLGIMQGALIQIVRNAVAHGIEAPSERIAAGKPAAGRVSIRVCRRGSKISFECRDDGRGIDLAAVRKVAAERGLLASADADLGAEDLVRLLLRGGISTSAAVTDVSGRGVGLDVVREALERLGGEVAVRIEPGRGTTFDLIIARSATSVAVLLVEAERGRAPVALPLDGVRGIVRVAPAEIADGGTGATILYDGKAVPFVALNAVLGDRSARRGGACTAVMVAGATGVAAFGIARLVGAARAVVRPLPERVDASAVVAGAAFDGEGNPQLILDPDGLVAAAHGVRAVPAEAVPAKRPVLVVDDSLTTRMLEKSILESAGYDVEVASSGEEGLDLARRKPFALILCDVEMPGIDGFTFVERIRADRALSNVPAILVTSRFAPEDRQRGYDVGAHGYIVKSEFNQAELLTMIRPIVG